MIEYIATLLNKLDDNQLNQLIQTSLGLTGGFMAGWADRAKTDKNLKNNIILAIDNDIIIGWSLEMYRTDSGAISIGVYVDKSHRNMNIGTELLKQLINKIKDKTDSIEVCMYNSSSFNFYKKALKPSSEDWKHDFIWACRTVPISSISLKESGEPHIVLTGWVTPDLKFISGIHNGTVNHALGLAKYYGKERAEEIIHQNPIKLGYTWLLSSGTTIAAETALSNFEKVKKWLKNNIADHNKVKTIEFSIFRKNNWPSIKMVDIDNLEEAAPVMAIVQQQHEHEFAGDFIEFIKRLENESKVGYDTKKNLWFPHVSPEGGLKTIGYGHKLRKENEFKNGISEHEVIKLLNQDLNDAKQKVYDYIKRKYNLVNIILNKHQLEMLTELVFNIGSPDKFPKFIDAVLRKDWNKAKQEYKRSYTDSAGNRKELVKRNNLFYDRYLKNVPLNENKMAYTARNPKLFDDPLKPGNVFIFHGTRNPQGIKSGGIIAQTAGVVIKDVGRKVFASHDPQTASSKTAYEEDLKFRVHGKEFRGDRFIVIASIPKNDIEINSKNGDVIINRNVDKNELIAIYPDKQNKTGGFTRIPYYLNNDYAEFGNKTWTKIEIPRKRI
jgi:GH24 family phage-related lysozyme (muramidase)/GNAT superfamily N-acetyltransferase